MDIQLGTLFKYSLYDDNYYFYYYYHYYSHPNKTSNTDSKMKTGSTGLNMYIKSEIIPEKKQQNKTEFSSEQFGQGLPQEND